MNVFKCFLRKNVLSLIVILLIICILWCIHSFWAIHTLMSRKPGVSRTVGLLFTSTLVTPRDTPWVFHEKLEDVRAKGWVGFKDLVTTNCEQMFRTQVNNSQYDQQVSRVYPTEYLEACANCSMFREVYGFLRYPRPTEEELGFPIAFVLLFHTDLDQVMLLLRAIYRPHNVYCLSVDTKSSVEFLEAVRAVSRCLPNVFVASKLENIVYAGFSRLMADIHCMEDLLLHPVQWRYVINMPGQQFPLRTNLEIVRILKIYNGSNEVESTDMINNDRYPERYKWKYRYLRMAKTGRIRLYLKNETAGKPPHGLEVVKGSTYGTFSRKFIHFALTSQVAKDLLDWVKPIYSPDEYFWSTLQHTTLMEVPGGYKASGPKANKPYLSSYTAWRYLDPCQNFFVRHICIFSPADLPRLRDRMELYVNKLYITSYPAALHCLDEWLVNRTFHGTTVDMDYYRALPFVKKSAE
ncbi:beta-1,3-galactosyl-O-glycosyl-glycoprotein beta-1,6-N-acetylglucosaminyltransferase-like [Physella acuta]|uniref:beta-1,3-galactosyl-O-glycosyl-glycoprotein beta-1,6-N-acetylglucosaminyltransferase-like n=1 Tax=Physella acuta TaxID=109671 RepID=UPI0027DC915D|nr:beta-1,3-galactosyl-O-glycosyl-glycoprotein beta-1,6-N-acetylglucosaminyltransferase-like [Physella acuta]